MSTHVLVLPDGRHDTLRGTLLLSVILHIVLLVLVVMYTMIGFHLGGGRAGVGYGGRDAHGSGTSLPGIPLPAPLVTTPSQVATQNTGLYKTEPQPKEEPPPDAQQIPKFKDSVKPERLELENNASIKKKKCLRPTPFRTVRAGAPTMSYTQVVTAAGTGGVAMGEGNSLRPTVCVVRGGDARSHQRQLAAGHRSAPISCPRRAST